MNYPDSNKRHCDLAILTVIDVELRAMRKAFGPAEPKGTPVNSRLYWETSVYSRALQRDLHVVIGNIARSGVVPATLRTMRFLADFRPTMIVLAGIAAGWREKHKIGNVVWPRMILDLAQSEEREGGRVYRPSHHKLPAEVQDMMQSGWLKIEDLTALTERIYGGKPKPEIGREDEFAKDVATTSKVEDCVIACGDTLVRNGKMFEKLRRKYDPQTQAFEMESSGMVQAIEDLKTGVAWLQVRGISDFGDAKKDNRWQFYAAASVAAFVRLFAEHGFNPGLIVGAEVEAAVPPAPSLATVPSAPPTTKAILNLASLGESSLNKLTEVNPFLHEFEEVRSNWRLIRDPATPEKLRLLLERKGVEGLTPDARAKMLVFAAEVELQLDNRDVAKVEALIVKAEELAGPNRVMRSRLTAARSGPHEGARQLESPETIEEWNQRMALLLEVGETEVMLKEWDTPPEGVGPNAESYRLRTLALITLKQIEVARKAFEKISSKHGQIFGIRFAGAALDYFEAISAALPVEAFRLLPNPIPIEFVKRDAKSLAALDRAAQTFEELSSKVLLGSGLHSELQHWRLAALANHATRRAEAEEYCRFLIARKPSDAQALAWASIRNYSIDREGSVAAMAAELGIKLL